MSTLLRLSLVCAILSSCGTAPHSTTQSTDSVPPVVGGYSTIDVSDSTIVACADFAVQQQVPPGSVRLVSIKDAQRQVVAGMNYIISMIIIRGEQTEHATATVWSKLDGSKELTSWESHRD